MAPKQVILTSNAPAPLAGIYSQAIVANGTVYCSGAIGMDPATGKLVEGDVQARTVSETILPYCGEKEKEQVADVGWVLASMHQKLDSRSYSSWNYD